MKKIGVGDKVTCLIAQAAYYSNYGGKPKMVFSPGMVGIVANIVPKVRMVKGEDRKPDFLVVDFLCPETNCIERVGLHFSNCRCSD